MFSLLLELRIEFGQNSRTLLYDTLVTVYVFQNLSALVTDSLDLLDDAITRIADYRVGILIPEYALLSGQLVELILLSLDYGLNVVSVLRRHY